MLVDIAVLTGGKVMTEEGGLRLESTTLDMLRQARERLPKHRFIEADIATWSPAPHTDLLFSNAVMQWLPATMSFGVKTPGWRYSCRGR